MSNNYVINCIDCGLFSAHLSEYSNLADEDYLAYECSNCFEQFVVRKDEIEEDDDYVYDVYEAFNIIEDPYSDREHWRRYRGNFVGGCPVPLSVLKETETAPRLSAVERNRARVTATAEDIIRRRTSFVETEEVILEEIHLELK